MVGDKAGIVKFCAARAAADVRKPIQLSAPQLPEHFCDSKFVPLAVASCRNDLAVSLADRRQAVAKDAMLIGK
jgi:hypothetical protein